MVVGMDVEWGAINDKDNITTMEWSGALAMIVLLLNSSIYGATNVF